MIRRPMARQEPGKPTLTYEVIGRVVHDACSGRGCTGCDFRGWMIDDEVTLPAFPIDPYIGRPLPAGEKP